MVLEQNKNHLNTVEGELCQCHSSPKMIQCWGKLSNGDFYYEGKKKVVSK